jgi:hypothetical protein
MPFPKGVESSPNHEQIFERLDTFQRPECSVSEPPSFQAHWAFEYKPVATSLGILGDKGLRSTNVYGFDIYKLAFSA